MLGQTELWRWTMPELGVRQALNELVLLLRALGGAAMLGNVCATPPASNHPATHAPSLPQLATSSSERASLVNARLDPALMDCVLDFLYR